jgi:aspartyl-tRNA(Asn)/glutamyl-tRNA(Gln) amidotransferase subunit C
MCSGRRSRTLVADITNFTAVRAVAARKLRLLYGGLILPPEAHMSVDAATVRRIAHLARIAVDEAEVPHLQGELNAMLAFVELLSEVDVNGVEPMTSVMPMEMKKRADVVNDGGIADEVVANAPATEDHFFLVPKVVE